MPNANRDKGRKQCRDCLPESARPAPYPGPRCATHHRTARKAHRDKDHDGHISRTYGVSRGFYARLIEAQDGRCAICRKATGKARRLALDHRHSDNAPRGALCYHCNRIIGLWGDDPEIFRRAARYLENPPAAALLIADDGEPSQRGRANWPTI